MVKTTKDLRRLVEARALVAAGAARTIRQAAGVSVRELAAAAGVSPSAVVRYELGDRTPRGPQGEAYAKALLELRDQVATDAG